VGGLGLFAAALELRDSVAEPRGLGLGRFEALAEGLGLLSKGRYVRPAGKGEALLRESDAVWSDLRRAYLPLDVVPVSIAL